MDRPALCGVCRRSEEVDGLRRCSLVVSESPALRAVMARAAVVARTTSSVVVHGETGTGKEVVARLVHANSPRRSGPFVAVNVAALPPELLESELFGHVRGAFTGAVTTTQGLFGEADGGTLFLDEIGEMPLPLQAKLLRVLQEGEVRRVGESKGRRVDVRVVSATHRDLKALVAQGSFREDLYYRLRVFGLVVPPLRDRRADILPLAQMFAARLGHHELRFSREARAALEKYRWPGNVRELGNVVEHAVAFAEGGLVEVAHLPEEVTSSGPAAPPAGALRSLAEMEHQHISAVLAACDNNQVLAAKVLGISRTTLWRKLSAPP
ncbi:MAG: sigma 54-interacting transcriptional regulator [Deltaproteobacteria bacterium]|nr:sigma 54-interacting transcriptional regulator [Deltaproteobacteria bacterium]